MSEPMSMSLGGSTQKTQECDSIDDGVNETKTVETNVWGQFFSINKLFSSVKLVDNEYTFGRAKLCSIIFNSDELQTSKYFLAYSSTHFKIVRDEKTDHVYIHDLSSNGTYINGEKLGKGNQQVLENHDEIALASKTHRVYVYIASRAREDSTIPGEIREKYIISRRIGRGAYGEVRLCFTRNTCDRFAIKIIPKKHFSHIGAQAHLFNEKIKSECNILQRLRHPCIIQISDVFDTPDALYIVLELVEGGELFDRIVSQGQLDEKTSKFLFRQICLGVKYLHDNSITHRDLKPENVLLTQQETNETLVKITDFGLSKFINETSLLKTFCGTPNYLAPEVLLTRGERSYTNKVDVWSLGVILYICLVGYPPFSESPDSPSLHEQIIKGLYTFPDEYWSGVSESAKSLIRQMMCVDPNKRLTINDALEHPWLANDQENSTRVEQIMSSSLTTCRSVKRRATTEATPMDDDVATSSMMDVTRRKRTKYEN